MIHALKTIPEYFEASAAGIPCAIRTRGEVMEPIHYESGAPVYERK